MRSRELSVQDYRALADFRYHIRQFLHFSEQASRSAGLKPQQHQLLLAVKGFAPGVEPTIGEIARRLHLRHHSAVELVDRMTQAGLVRKHRSDADRRRVLLGVTPRGETVLRKLSIVHRAELKSLRSALINSLDEIIHDKKRTR